MFTLGRTLLFLGFLITVAALLFFVFGNIEFPRGNTIGDWEYHSQKVHVYVPILACVIVSALLTFVFWILKRR